MNGCHPMTSACSRSFYSSDDFVLNVSNAPHDHTNPLVELAGSLVNPLYIYFLSSRSC